jgi:hypothetical protein
MECLLVGAAALAASAEGTVVLGLTLSGIMKSAVSSAGGVLLVGLMTSRGPSTSANQCDASCSNDSLTPALGVTDGTISEVDDSSQSVEP